MSGQRRTTPTALVLASRSPRRQEALSALGVPYRIAVSEIEETLASPDDQTDPVPIAVAKARDITQREPDAAVLAGDTIVVLDGQSLGKPASPEDAMRMLKLLRGREHEVVTALALAEAGQIWTAAVLCPLRMRNYDDVEIERYVESGEPLDCAGAYDVHRLGGALVESVEGCIATVVGFPIAQAAAVLRAAGFELPNDPVGVCTALYGRPCHAAEPGRAADCFDPRSMPA